MVSLGEDGQVIVITSIIVSLILLSLSTVLFTGTTYHRHYFEAKSDQGDYIYYELRYTYEKTLQTSLEEKDVNNPFNSTRLNVYEDQVSDYCQRRGYMVSFQNKSFNADENIAKVTLVFSGEGLKYYERLSYDLQ